MDIGSGTGHTGNEIIGKTALELTEVDIADRDMSGRPPLIFDGKTLPFESSEFNTVLVLFTLQYASDPVGMIREAIRVSKGQVVIMQTTSPNGIKRFYLNAYDWISNCAWHWIVKLSGAVRKGPNSIVVRQQFSEMNVKNAIYAAGGRLIKHEKKGTFLRRRLFVVESSSSPDRVQKFRDLPRRKTHSIIPTLL